MWTFKITKLPFFPIQLALKFHSGVICLLVLLKLKTPDAALFRGFAGFFVLFLKRFFLGIFTNNKTSDSRDYCSSMEILRQIPWPFWQIVCAFIIFWALSLPLIIYISPFPYQFPAHEYLQSPRNPDITSIFTPSKSWRQMLFYYKTWQAQNPHTHYPIAGSMKPRSSAWCLAMRLDA